MNLIDNAATSAAWKAFRSGKVVQCERDAAPLSLSVDGHSETYSFVCTRCGARSRWFRANHSSLKIRVVHVVELSPDSVP